MDIAYIDKLKNPKWQKKRLKIFNRDNWACRICGETKETLHIHHIKYLFGKEPWEYPDNLLSTICDNCHKKLHGKSHIPTIKEIFELCKYEIEDGVIQRISQQPIHEVLQSLKAGRESR